jgi:hypothetical protein
MIKIGNAALLKIGQVLGVVKMTLRVQVAVADFDGVGEFEIGHSGIIQ